MGETDHLEEARETADVACPALELDFLLEVERRIRLQDLLRLGRGDHQGQEPALEGSAEVKAGQFGRHERMHGLVQRSPGEQVDAPASELAGTRTSQHELSGHGLLDQGMDHVQEFRDALHLIHDDRGLLGRSQHELTESLRASAHLAVDVWLQQIDKEGLRKQVPQPGRLTCPARSE
jgi:hypothetical protein